MSAADTRTQTVVHTVAQAVALSRLQARRAEERSPLVPNGAADFADTVPLWFRSEAFAEDVNDHVSRAAGQEHTPRAGSLVAIDRRVLASGAAVLRQTLQAFKQQRW